MALLVARRGAHPPMESGRVVQIESLDYFSGRATVAVRWPNVQPISMIELDLQEGTWSRLPTLTRQVRYAAGDWL